MLRAVTALWMSTVALAGMASAATAHAQPPPQPGPCSFTLSPPQVVQVSGADMVTATVVPAGCLGMFEPKFGVACLHVQGGPGKCAQSTGRETAQVFEPYQPGTTYVSSGRGCGAMFDFTTDPNCQLLGPVTATL
ncbi:hypothetical protein ABQF17_09740 [Mycolicibacterium elephantis]|uniref:Secreted protein n=1 Tax=Mycolicibacterium elephantis TaxID=81858 RepID=A0A0M2ZII4_9MYCO|nr:hypothetical protein [Mycolicibacterium elephantis]KKW63995.1 hypothetical protein AAV95_14405 [Mycolicibacterium elephantis]OBA73593.1 hypothetical protein A5633_21335 [Mycolicibacterium elephantis]OBB23716.1 hypothetical protein A5762_13535 [Mycolicibacterium elephantis]OBE96902.1 hypothetical protein A5776_18285 [Mycolicibacterium elephantis]ORA66062.1 hypothetical protein BST23_11660 [Mycolicibacterium elephantis]